MIGGLARGGGGGDGGGIGSPGNAAPSAPEENAQWTLHLADPPADGAETIKLSGCTLPLPAKPAPSFWRAVEHGDTARVEALISNGEDINQLGGAYGSTALGWAALAADEPMMTLCLSRGADVNLKSRKGSAPLHMAVWNFDNVGAVQQLLGAGADPSVTNHHGQTALELAKWFHSLEEPLLPPTSLSSTPGERPAIRRWTGARDQRARGGGARRNVEGGATGCGKRMR